MVLGAAVLEPTKWMTLVNDTHNLPEKRHQLNDKECNCFVASYQSNGEACLLFTLDQSNCK